MDNQVEDNHLLLLRGLPGSGKTELAKVLSEYGKYPIISVDDYFTDTISGVYQFNYKENYLAYKSCEDNTLAWMKKNIRLIIVHNTFTMEWEIQPYFKLASDYNYKLFIVTVENYHDNKNIHGVTQEQLSKMASKYKVKLL